YYPAIAEAFYSDIPLVVISADRPAYKVDIGDGQTIRQENVFANQIGYEANLKLDVSHATDKIRKYDPISLGGRSLIDIQADIQGFNDKQLDIALNMACFNNVPVHINVPFEEPLYNTIEKPIVAPKVHFAAGPLEELDMASFQRYVHIWYTAARKIVLDGVIIHITIAQS